MQIIDGGNYAYTRGVSYPIVVTEDTEYRLANFAQKDPHTAIFDVAPGVTLRLVDCNLQNVTVPDGAILLGGNLAHGVHAPGDLQRETIFILCECVKCVTAQAILAAGVKDGTLPRDRNGRVLHHDIKEAFRLRRLDAAKVSGDRTVSASENAAAMARVGGTMRASLQTAVGRGT